MTKKVKRICQGCRKSESKQSLERLVRMPDGKVVYDPEHKIEGRGYHFHKECSGKSLVPGKVTHFLKCEGGEGLEKLMEEVKVKLEK